MQEVHDENGELDLECESLNLVFSIQNGYEKWELDDLRAAIV